MGGDEGVTLLGSGVTAPLGRATVADGGTAKGTVAFGIGAGVGEGLEVAVEDCNLTVARGNAGDVAAIAGSSTASLTTSGTGLGGAGVSSFVRLGGVPVDDDDRRGTVLVPAAATVAATGDVALGTVGGVTDAGLTGAGGALDIGAVTGVAAAAGLNRGGGGGVEAPDPTAGR
jgi:hypothetical protein